MGGARAAAGRRGSSRRGAWGSLSRRARSSPRTTTWSARSPGIAAGTRRLNACAAGAVLAAAAASGLTAADLGLGREARGGRGGSGPGWPPPRPRGGWPPPRCRPRARPLDDKRITALSGRALAYQVVVRIPVGTVLWEEIAFRGVLQAALRRVMPEPAAIAVTSGVFGIWHIRPTAAALRVNGLAGEPRAGRDRRRPRASR